MREVKVCPIDGDIMEPGESLFAHLLTVHAHEQEVIAFYLVKALEQLQDVVEHPSILQVARVKEVMPR